MIVPDSRLTAVLRLLAFACLAVWMAVVLPVSAQEPPTYELTTDTPAYCTQLAHDVASRHSALPEVERLLAEGEAMCERGQIRGGILRLRRALLILHHRGGRSELQLAPSQLQPSQATPPQIPASQVPGPQ